MAKDQEEYKIVCKIKKLQQVNLNYRNIISYMRDKGENSGKKKCTI